MPELKTDKVVNEAREGLTDSQGTIPRSPPDSLHQQDFEVYGIAEHPVKVFIRAFELFFRTFDRWKYSDDDRLTNIYIRSDYPKLGKNAKESDMKPAIIVQRTGEIRRKQVDGRSMFRGKQFLDRDGNRVFVFKDNIQTSITMHCASKEGQEATRIASAVFSVLNVDEETFKKVYKMHALIPPSMSVEGILVTDVEQELVTVPVTVQVEYPWAWARRADGTIFENLELEVTDP